MIVQLNIPYNNNVFQEYFPLVYFFYGLAFFVMGFAILLEVGRGGDKHLRIALAPLAAFGLVHGINEWLEMFSLLGLLPGMKNYPQAWEMILLVVLIASFVSLSAFGILLLIKPGKYRSAILWLLVLMVVWGLGIVWLTAIYPRAVIFDVANVWTRYSLAVPGAILATLGLGALQRDFRQTGMAGFGRDALWAAVAFFWYGVIGQTFVRASPLPPSNILNQGLFLEVFGFPVQLLRAATAIIVAFFIVKFLRSFEVATRYKIAELQEARLEEAQNREALRGDMLRRIVAAQEAERQRIARELHDETGQSLTAIGLGIRAVSTSRSDNPERAAQNLRRLEDLTAQSITELRRIIADLRPSHLDDLGLASTLRWYAGEIENRSGLRVHLEQVGEERPLPSEMTITLFRLAQEALTNVIRHAHATQAKVQLNYGQDDVLLTVEDDGLGFHPDMVNYSTRSPFGLLGMRERALLLGGVCTITSKLDQGTKVEVTIPYPVVGTGEEQADE